MDSGRGVRSKPPHAAGEELLKKTRPPHRASNHQISAQPMSQRAGQRGHGNLGTSRLRETKEWCAALAFLLAATAGQEGSSTQQQRCPTPLPRRHGRPREEKQLKNRANKPAEAGHMRLFGGALKQQASRLPSEEGTTTACPGGHPVLRRSTVGYAPSRRDATAAGRTQTPTTTVGQRGNSRQLVRSQGSIDLIRGEALKNTGGRSRRRGAAAANGADLMLRQPPRGLRPDHRQQPTLPTPKLRAPDLSSAAHRRHRRRERPRIGRRALCRLGLL
jgi:hypothetical protein